jgi:hypothetical protein
MGATKAEKIVAGVVSLFIIAIILLYVQAFGETYTFIDSPDDGGVARYVATDGTYAYLANDDDGLRAYSTDGATISSVGHVDPGGFCRGVWTDGTYIHAAFNSTVPAWSRIYVYTFSGTVFNQVDMETLTGRAYGVSGSADGTKIFVAVYTAGVTALSFNGSAYSIIDTQDDGTAVKLHYDETNVHTAYGAGGLFGYGYDEVTLSLIDDIDNGGNYEDVKTDGTYIHAACGTSGIRAYTLNGTYTNVGSRDDGGTYSGIYCDEVQFIHAACGTSGIRAHTFNGTAYSLEDTYNTPGDGYSVTSDGTYVWMADGTSGIAVLSFSAYPFSSGQVIFISQD